MANIEIDGVDYDLDSLSEDVKAQLQFMQLTDQMILQTQQKLAVLQTARNAYAVTLRELLESEQPE